MIEAKKSLGQNFLQNPLMISEILKAGEVKTGDTVLEIGPGEGVLTAALLKIGAKVIAIEKDDRLIGFLSDKFADEIKTGQFTLIHGDVLDFSPESSKPKAESYKLIANIPYYLTGQILRRFLSSNCQPAKMVLMIQKEVAERICAKDGKATRQAHGKQARGKESILSVSVKAYGEPKYVRTVPRGNFRPIPNVDSAILLIDKISKQFFENISEDRFFDLIHRGFGQKRKMLKGNLKLSEETLNLCQIPPKARAEDLDLTQWKCLARELKAQKSKLKTST